ncbi:MAG: OprD family outer membrane porin [Flavobacteriales bacterium]|nr:OprD family outer membrane porin [Flavobacteriales bacterium]
MQNAVMTRSHSGRWGLAFVLMVAWPLIGSAQHSEQDIPSNDSLRGASHLYDIMKRGELDGRFRLYNMMTINDGAPADYHAVAFGGTLGFTSQRWHGTRFKLSGGYTFDLETSDLTVLDPITDAANRYEIGLYDVNDPRHTNDLAYLHEFQLDWLSRNERTQVVIGKQELNTPFLNPQDGRMHPSLFEGIWAQHRTQHGTALQGGWIYRVAPRGASEWYAVDESMSVFPVGRNVYGEGAQHGEHVESAGLFATSIKQKVHRSLSITVWNVHTENVFNSALMQLDAGSKEARWSASAMAIRQDAARYRGHSNDSLSYMPGSEASWAFSARLRNVLGKFRWQLNYTRITADGRYLMPREWGRDPFFTFLPRERNEGAGDVHAASLNLIWKADNGWRIQVDGGLYRMPELTDARLNKYAMPSYTQFDVNAQYQFNGGWKGLAAQVLVLAKLPLHSNLTERQSINKVDMLHADLIINYVF